MGNEIEKDEYNDDGEKLTMETRGRSRTPRRATGGSSSTDMDLDNSIDGERGTSSTPASKKQKRSVSVVRARDRSMSVKRPEEVGIRDTATQAKIIKMAKKAQVPRNMMARKGEADHFEWPKLVRHLNSGKSGLGTSTIGR